MALFKMADSFPSETGDTGKDVKSLRSYVYQMQETLRYVLGNLGGENFNEADLGNITEPIYARIEDAEEMSTEVSVTAQGIQAQVVEQGQSIASLQVTANGLTSKVASVEGQYSQISQTINGLEITTSTDEEGVGTTYISGNSIKSGTIIGTNFKVYGWQWYDDEDDGEFEYGYEIYDANPNRYGLRIGRIGYRDDSDDESWIPTLLISADQYEEDGQYKYPRIWMEGDGGIYLVSYEKIALSTAYIVDINASGNVKIESSVGVVRITDNSGTKWEFNDGHLYRDGKEML